MDVDQMRIHELVVGPSEGLNVEIKRWVDPDDPSGIQVIVKACFALRNRNGGFLVFGFDDKTLLPEPTNRPSNVPATFHKDKIQVIISRYASETFEIGIGFETRDGHQHAVIVVPPGVTAPVAVKSDLNIVGKIVLGVGDVYFRTLRANGTPSSARARPEDWREILEICFENREADIGRFLRRHLTNANVGVLAAVLGNTGASSAPPPPSLCDRAIALLADGERRFNSSLARHNLSEREKPLLDAGRWSVAVIVDPPKSDVIADQVFLNTIMSSNPRYTGWPPWIDSRVTDYAPIWTSGGWEALILAVQSWSSHLDFWRADPKGEFYLLRNLQDDLTDKVAPRTWLDPLLVLRRVTEVLAVGIAFAKALGWDTAEARLGFAFQWTTLKGRRLTPWVDPFAVIGGGTAYDDDATTCIELSLDTPANALAPFVEQATRSLFAQFEGAKIHPDVIEDIVRRVLERG
jgi:hypothetical protein